MKKYLLMTLAALMLLSASATAMDYFYYTRSLNSMDHNRAYTWGMNTQWSAGETITGAVLTFYGIYDWTVEQDMLFVSLLDYGSLGVSSLYDGENPISDYFSGMGTPIGSWSDPNGGSGSKTDVSFTFGAAQLAALTAYSADGRFAIAADPDCHYYASNTELVVSTGAIPEPGTLILVGLGLTGLGLIRRK